MYSAYTNRPDTESAIQDLIDQLGNQTPKAMVFFAAHTYNGTAISKALHEHFKVDVIGCTTAGEFSEKVTGTGGISILALPETKIKRGMGQLIHFGRDLPQSLREASYALYEGFGSNLRNLDPEKYVGILLIDGLHGKEELVNEVLGTIAPTLHFVGGSAGDNLEFKETRIFYNGQSTKDGAAILLLETKVPFTVLKTCSFESMRKSFTITKADVAHRTVLELNGRPAAEVYAEALGVKPEQLDSSLFMRHPLGLMMDGKPWIRSPQQTHPGGGIKFYCQILEGMEVDLMQSRDLIEETRRAVQEAKNEVETASLGLMFNCILRRLEIDQQDKGEPFVGCFEGLEVAGFHTYGESWFGHINQTLTGLVL